MKDSTDPSTFPPTCMKRKYLTFSPLIIWQLVTILHETRETLPLLFVSLFPPLAGLKMKISRMGFSAALCLSWGADLWVFVSLTWTQRKPEEMWKWTTSKQDRRHRHAQRSEVTDTNHPPDLCNSAFIFFLFRFYITASFCIRNSVFQLQPSRHMTRLIGAEKHKADSSWKSSCIYGEAAPNPF